MSDNNHQNHNSSDSSIRIFRDSILDSFSEVKDPRILGSSIHHSLGDVFFIAFCAILCGANNLREVFTYAESRKMWLCTVLQLSHGIPSYTTFWWIFVMLDPLSFHSGFLKWVDCISEVTDGEVYAIDGKALRGTAIKGKANSFIHMVSLWATSQELTLGQVKVDGKSNEITAIPKLLEMIDIEGATVTIDAMGTQTEIARKIVERGADYVLALKGNQSNLHDEIQNFFEQAEQANFEGVNYQTCHIEEEGHGRREARSVFVTNELDWLPKRDEWKDLQSIVLVRSKRTIEGTTSEERRYYISSLPADGQRMAHAIRSHWGIESCHWILDVAFKEDALKARAGHIAENHSLMRKVALALLKRDTKTAGGVETRRKRAGWDPEYLLKLVGVKF